MKQIPGYGCSSQERLQKCTLALNHILEAKDYQVLSGLRREYLYNGFGKWTELMGQEARAQGIFAFIDGKRYREGPRDVVTP